VLALPAGPGITPIVIPHRPLGRHLGRYHRHRYHRFHWRDRKFGRRLADQNRDRVLELGSGHADCDRLRLCAFELRLGLGDGRLVRGAALILVAEMRSDSA
jgi:hypothetical protein